MSVLQRYVRRGLAPVVVLMGVSVPPADAQALPTDAEIRQMLVDRIDGKQQGVGMVIGIVTPTERRVIAHGRFGKDDPRPVNDDTVFEIGSVTKVFTSLLLAEMVQRGEVKLDDRVAGKLALIDLATHTSGLPFWPSSIPPTGEGVARMASCSVDQLDQFISTFEVPADVGSRWAYSNIDAGLLGLALARRNGASYEALLQKRVTGPLGMASTAVTLSPELTSRLAIGHDKQLNAAPRWEVPALAGAGSLHSSANDLLQFLAAAMGHVASPLAPAMASMLATRRPGPAFQQALGWWIFTEGEQQFVMHAGGTLGFASLIGYRPSTRVGIVVLSNSAHAIGDLPKQLLR